MPNNLINQKPHEFGSVDEFWNEFNLIAGDRDRNKFNSSKTIDRPKEGSRITREISIADDGTRYHGYKIYPPGSDNWRYFATPVGSSPARIKKAGPVINTSIESGQLDTSNNAQPLPTIPSTRALWSSSKSGHSVFKMPQTDDYYVQNPNGTSNLIEQRTWNQLQADPTYNPFIYADTQHQSLVGNIKKVSGGYVRRTNRNGRKYEYPRYRCGGRLKKMRGGGSTANADQSQSYQVGTDMDALYNAMSQLPAYQNVSKEQFFDLADRIAWTESARDFNAVNIPQEGKDPTSATGAWQYLDDSAITAYNRLNNFQGELGFELQQDYDNRTAQTGTPEQQALMFIIDSHKKMRAAGKPGIPFNEFQNDPQAMENWYYKYHHTNADPATKENWRKKQSSYKPSSPTTMGFRHGGNLPKYKNGEEVNSSFATSFIKGMPFLNLLPENAKHYIASTITGDKSYNIDDYSTAERMELFRSINNAIERTEKERGGTEYVDFSPEMHTALQKLKANIPAIMIGMNSPDLVAATKSGRVSYDMDDDGIIKVLDSYDFSQLPNESRGTRWGKIRGKVGDIAKVRGMDDGEAQVVGHFDRNQMQKELQKYDNSFIYNPPGMGPLNITRGGKARVNFSELYPTAARTAQTIKREMSEFADRAEQEARGIITKGSNWVQRQRSKLPFQTGGVIPKGTSFTEFNGGAITADRIKRQMAMAKNGMKLY